MSITSWAFKFGEYFGLLLQIFELEILPGTGITLMDFCIWCIVATIIIGAIYKMYS